ncbi:DUF799 domain-containing protein [Piscinibacter sp. XHJ-5]|uniref:DUF799 domain-containing protein n=1 Tax=Piscinibacter sp. XHJ-5 TaxID=3037797 RepID=UPI00245319D1|nr:DUF799 domain-containing protein [Piscinibacter sp. XHJ-5]
MNAKRAFLWVCVAGLMVLGGCATKAPPHDYSAWMKAKPATLLVMPPVNDSPDIKATSSVWSHATQPLSEAGYYVLPVTLVDETFRQNGVQTASDAHDIPYTKLRDVFGADAAVYIRVKRYGTSYAVVSSETRVDVEARIVDLRSGALLWQGQAFASSAEQQQQSQGGLVGLLVTAVVKQIIGTATDAAYNYAGIANARMLAAPRYNGVLAGPRSPLYGQPPPSQ